MDDHLARFRSLQGNNLQETKRSFNGLVDDIRLDVPLEADLDVLIASLKPMTRLESVLKVEILLRFKKYDALLEILKSGNPLLIGKVLKCWKLFEVVFSEIDARTLVDQIFPQTSSSTRLKIITRLSTNLKNEVLADDYFHAIEDKYGLFVARGLLPACSLDLIKSTVANYKLNLTSRQLLNIFRRDREFLGYYFGVMHQVHGENFDFSGRYPQVLRYVAKVDEPLFWELFKKYKLKSKFGRHMTPRLYQSGKEVATTADYDQGLFNLRKLCKFFGKNADLHSFISKLLPKKADAFVSTWYSHCLKTLIGCVSRNRRYEVLNACFEKAYGQSIPELLSVDTPTDLMELMPLKEREIIADEKVQKDEGLIYMYPPKRAIPLLQERIKLTSSIRKRSSLVQQLYKTCLINEDGESLLEVLKYVNSRHRNDDVVLSNFMISLQEWPKLQKLSGEHWIYINELLNVCKRMSDYRLYKQDLNFIMNYVLHLRENEMPCEEFMETFLRDISEKPGLFDMFFFKKLPDCEKFCYENFARLLPKLFAGDELETLICSFLVLVIYYNAGNPKRKITISDHPYFLKALKVQMTKQNYYCAETVLKYYLKYEDDGRGDQIFWDNHEKTCNANMVIWYLRKRPRKILEHLDKILTPTVIKELMYRLPNTLSLASMLSSIPEKIVSFSLNALHHDAPVVSKFAVTSLSYLTTTEKYFEVARSFFPLRSEGKTDFKVTQEAIVKDLANLDDPASCLSVLEEICAGGYMKHAPKTLHRLISHAPESKLESFLDSFYRNSAVVSVRKQIVNITARVSPKTFAYDFLKNCSQDDNHPTLNGTIFKNILWCFVANPGEEFWDLLRDNVKIVDENDGETLGRLLNLHRIPDRYFPEYFSMAYAVLSSHKNKQVQEKKYDLLASVQNESVNKLSASSLATVIEDTFPDATQKTDFYLKCLFYTSGPKRALVLDLVFKILKDCVDKSCDLHNIIHAICRKAVALKNGKSLIEKLMEFCSFAMEHGKLFEEHLLLQLAKSYLTLTSEAKPEEYGAKVIEIFEEFVGLYGLSVISIFTRQLNDFLMDLPHVASDEKFIEGLLRVNDADFNYILALNFLFDRANWYEINARYGSVLIKIGEHKSSTVQIHLHQRLRNVKD